MFDFINKFNLVNNKEMIIKYRNLLCSQSNININIEAKSQTKEFLKKNNETKKNCNNLDIVNEINYSVVVEEIKTKP